MLYHLFVSNCSERTRFLVEGYFHLGSNLIVGIFFLSFRISFAKAFSMDCVAFSGEDKEIPAI